jgi:hypothetical protein
MVKKRIIVMCHRCRNSRAYALQVFFDFSGYSDMAYPTRPTTAVVPPT